MINQTPRNVQRVPFASESGLQRFVEDNAEDLLGVKVVASSRAGGGCLFKIDTLAVDRDGQPWIIECKHDLVDSRALTQLRRYRTALMDGWAKATTVLRSRHHVGFSDEPEPVLVLIGYRFDEGFASDEVVRLVYRYHDIQLLRDAHPEQTAGRVSLHNAGESDSLQARHPKVSKKLATVERLQRLAPALSDSFWDVDKELRRLGAKVTYGGKNFVRYSTSAGIFAEAVIGSGAIRWRPTLSCLVEDASDTAALLDVLRYAADKRANLRLQPTAAGIILSRRG